MKNPFLSFTCLLIGLIVFAIMVKPGQAQDSEPEFDTTILDEETQTMLIELEQQKWGVFAEDSSMSSIRDVYAEDFINVGWFGPMGMLRQNKAKMLPALAENPPLRDRHPP